MKPTLDRVVWTVLIFALIFPGDAQEQKTPLLTPKVTPVETPLLVKTVSPGNVQQTSSTSLSSISRNLTPFPGTPINTNPEGPWGSSTSAGGGGGQGSSASTAYRTTPSKVEISTSVVRQTPVRPSSSGADNSGGSSSTVRQTPVKPAVSSSQQTPQGEGSNISTIRTTPLRLASISNASPASTNSIRVTPIKITPSNQSPASNIISNITARTTPLRVTASVGGSNTSQTNRQTPVRSAVSSVQQTPQGEGSNISTIRTTPVRLTSISNASPASGISIRTTPPRIISSSQSPIGEISVRTTPLRVTVSFGGSSSSQAFSIRTTPPPRPQNNSSTPFQLGSFSPRTTPGGSIRTTPRRVTPGSLSTITPFNINQSSFSPPSVRTTPPRFNSSSQASGVRTTPKMSVSNTSVVGNISGRTTPSIQSTRRTTPSISRTSVGTNSTLSLPQRTTPSVKTTATPRTTPTLSTTQSTSSSRSPRSTPSVSTSSTSLPTSSTTLPTSSTPSTSLPSSTTTLLTSSTSGPLSTTTLITTTTTFPSTTTTFPSSTTSSTTPTTTTFPSSTTTLPTTTTTTTFIPTSTTTTTTTTTTTPTTTTLPTSTTTTTTTPSTTTSTTTSTTLTSSTTTQPLTTPTPSTTTVPLTSTTTVTSTTTSLVTIPAISSTTLVTLSTTTPTPQSTPGPITSTYVQIVFCNLYHEVVPDSSVLNSYLWNLRVQVASLVGATTDRIQDVTIMAEPNSGRLVLQFLISEGFSPSTMQILTRIRELVYSPTDPLKLIDLYQRTLYVYCDKPRYIYNWTDYGPCPIHMCFNGGICGCRPAGRFYCICKNSYTGEFCEIAPSSSKPSGPNYWPLLTIPAVIGLLLLILGLLYCCKYCCHWTCTWCPWCWCCAAPVEKEAPAPVIIEVPVVETFEPDNVYADLRLQSVTSEPQHMFYHAVGRPFAVAFNDGTFNAGSSSIVGPSDRFYTGTTGKKMGIVYEDIGTGRAMSECGATACRSGSAFADSDSYYHALGQKLAIAFNDRSFNTYESRPRQDKTRLYFN